MSEHWWRWTKLTTAKWEDAWRERLNTVAPENLVMVRLAGSRALRIQAYLPDQSLGKQLLKQFGGELKKIQWKSETRVTEGRRRPIPIRGKLLICRSPEDALTYSGRAQVLVIPSGLAFGTGDHATTAGCLRFLCDTVKHLPATWRALDLGTGSGILALAADRLGADEVFGIDNDLSAVKTARHNAKVNRCSRKVRFAQGDATKPQQTGRYELVLANLFSGVLCRAASVIARQLQPGGYFIFSGVLAAQQNEVVEALAAQGIQTEHILKRGKWVAGLCKNAS